MTSKWKTIRHKPVPPAQRLPLHEELDAIGGGDAAFKARIPFYNCPYTIPTLKNAWIRGFKRSERDWNESLKRSSRLQETLELEEVEA
jgi:hypothetical protein